MLTNLPNPSCCRTDNLAHLCDNCREDYLKANPILPAYRYANVPITDPTDILPLPTMKYGEEDKARNKRESQPEFVRNGVMANGGDPWMIPPRINWTW